MNDVKWLKLYTNIFENRKIKQIETLPKGDTIIVIWFKLLILASNVNDSGLIYFTKDLPYTDKMLATQFNKPLNTVKTALNIFEEYGMIGYENNILYITGWGEYQNTEGMEKIKEQTRKRVQNYRSKQKQCNATEKDDCNVTCNVTVTQCNATDKEIDIEEEYKKEKIYKKEKTSTTQPKQHFGEYKHVLLTNDEYEKLKRDYPNVESLITYLDEYIEMKGYKAKSHYLAIKKWVVDAEQRNKPKEKQVEKLEVYDSSKNREITEEELKAFEELRGNT